MKIIILFIREVFTGTTIEEALFTSDIALKFEKLPLFLQYFVLKFIYLYFKVKNFLLNAYYRLWLCDRFGLRAFYRFAFHGVILLRDDE